jgi:hypothetical protein
MKEDAAASAKARDLNALRQAEIALCRSGCTRAEARSLLNKIKGTPGAAPETPTPGAGDLIWLGAAAELTQAIVPERTPMKHVSMAALAASTALAQPRAVQSFAPRADGEDPAKILGDLKKTFNDFMSENDTRLKALEKGKEDVVTNEKVEKINSAVGELQTAIDDMSKKLAAAQLHGGDPDPNATPSARPTARRSTPFSARAATPRPWVSSP